MVLGVKSLRTTALEAASISRTHPGTFKRPLYLRSSTVDDDVERERNTLMSYTGHSAQRCFKSDTPFVLFLAPHVLPVTQFLPCVIEFIDSRCVVSLPSRLGVYLYSDVLIPCLMLYVF